MMGTAALILFVSFVALGFISLGFSFYFGASSFKKTHKAAYSLLSGFPFELFEAKDLLSNLSRVFFFIYAACSLGQSALILILQGNASFQYLLGLGVILLLLKGGEIGTMLGLTYVPAYDNKRHLALFVAFGGVSFLEALVSGFASLNLGKMLPEAPVLSYAFMIVFFVIALALGILMLNPKLTHWPELKTEMSEDGSILTVRPRPFILAFSEWIVVFINLIVPILLGAEILAFCFQLESI